MFTPVKGDIGMLKFALSEIVAGGEDHFNDHGYSLVGDNNQGFEVSLIEICEESLSRITQLEQERDQYRAAEEAQIALRAKMERQRDSLQRLANNRAEQRDSLLVYVGKLQDVIRRMDWESRMLDPEQTAVFEEARQLIAQPVTNDLERRDTLKQAEGAAMVAESAWSRKNLDAFGSTPQECAANLATLIGNDLRWKADYKPEDCDLECGAYGTFCKCKAEGGA